MKQHIYKGRGVPSTPPPVLSAHYIDLDTGDSYISRGTDYKEDWGSPLLDKKTVVALLNEFEEALSRGEGLNSIVEMEVSLIAGERVVEIHIPVNAGRFVSITDPTDSVEPYEIRPVIPFGETIRKGMEFKVFNNTRAEPTVTHETDIVFISGSTPIAPSIQIKGVVTVKHVAIVDDKRQWLVYGDTSRNSNDTVAVAENAAKLDGFTRQQIIAEARLISDNTRRLGGLEGGSYQTDLEADEALTVVSAAIDTLTATI